MQDTAEWVYEEGREAYRRQAFLAWHQSNTLAGMFSGSKELPSFGEFLDTMGLGDGTAESPQAETAEEALQTVLQQFGVANYEEQAAHLLTKG